MAQFFKAKKAKRRSTPSLKALTITIDALTLQGQGLCKSHVPIIIVDGALPGETVKVTITQQKKKVWFAKVLQVLESHPQRIAAPCAFALDHTTKQTPICGGCQLQYVAPEALLTLKETAISDYATHVLPVTELPWIKPVLSLDAYRRKARLAIDARDANNIKVGFRQAHSNNVLAIDHCQVLDPRLQAVLSYIQTHCQQWGWLSNVGHMTLFAADNETVLALNAQRHLNGEALSALLALETDLAVRVAVHQQGLVDAPKQGPKWYFLPASGQTDTNQLSVPDLWLSSIDDCRYPVDLDDFVQVNKSLNEQMVSAAVSALELVETDRVLDLFCGAGNFTLPIARRAEYALGVEGVPTMVQQAQRGAKMCSMDNVEFIHADLTTAAALDKIKAAKINKLLLDPSREGASAVLECLQYNDLEKIVYVSCNPQTWVHDCALIMANGFKLTQVQSFDMFKGTTHTELLSVFIR